MKKTVHYQRKYTKKEVYKHNELVKKVEKMTIHDSAFQSSEAYKHFYWTLDNTFLTRAQIEISIKDSKSNYIATAIIEKSGQYPVLQSEIETILLQEKFKPVKSR